MHVSRRCCRTKCTQQSEHGSTLVCAWQRCACHAIHSPVAAEQRTYSCAGEVTSHPRNSQPTEHAYAYCTDNAMTLTVPPMTPARLCGTPQHATALDIILLRTLMNFFLQILCGLGLRGPSSACWLRVRSYTRPDMVLLKLFRRSVPAKQWNTYTTYRQTSALVMWKESYTGVEPGDKYTNCAAVCLRL